MKKAITKSFEQTQQLGFDLAKKANNLQVVALHGDLGAGKTTFVQGFAKGIGITKKIISPTFIIMRTYELKGEGSKKMFYHVDLYRVESERDVEGLGLLEIMQDPENLVVIEWPEKVEKILPSDKLHVYFTYLGDQRRGIKIG